MSHCAANKLGADEVADGNAVDLSPAPGDGSDAAIRPLRPPRMTAPAATPAPAPDAAARSERLRILLAFAAVWIIWGSTYLAIRIVLETLPPFLAAGGRFLTAGAVLFTFTAIRGAKRPTLAHWRSAALLGALLLLLGNGSVMFAEQRIASGPAALLIATEPLMIVLLQGIIPRGKLLIGLLLGFFGVAVLLGPAAILGGGALNAAACIAVIFGGTAWAAGSLLGRRLQVPENGMQAAALQMLCGGAWLMGAAALHGDFTGFHPAQVSSRSWLAVAYLVIFGSMIAFTAYGYLVRRVSPSRLATYAYVNPVVAVALGCLLGGEAFTPRLLLAALLIVAGVVMIIRHSAKTAG